MTEQVPPNAYEAFMQRYEKEVQLRCETNPQFQSHVIDMCVALSDNPIGALAKGRSNDIILYWQCGILGKTECAICKRLKIPKVDIDRRIRHGRRVIATHLIQKDPKWQKEYQKIMDQDDWDVEM